jgi:hypothetical protein
MIQKAYTTILQYFIQHGRAPHYTELARMLGISPSQARELQAATAEAGVACWLVPQTDYVESWAPFYNVPNHHRVTVNGEQKWFGQCGIEALAVRWMFPGKQVRLDTACLDCGEPVTVVMRDEEVIQVDPATAVGHMNNPFSATDWHTNASFY